MEGIITVIIIVISIIGWISNAINENKQKAQQAGGKKRPQQRKLKDELESFLQELQGDKSKPQQEKKQQNRPQRQKVRKSQSKRLAQEERKRSALKNRKRSPSQHPKHKSIFQNEEERHVGSGDLGQRITKHVEEHIQTRHPGGVKPDDESAFKKEDQEIRNAPRKGQSSSPLVTLSANKQAVELLQSTDSVRAAIILNEILQPPVSQRPEHF